MTLARRQLGKAPNKETRGGVSPAGGSSEMERRALPCCEEGSCHPLKCESRRVRAGEMSVRFRDPG